MIDNQYYATQPVAGGWEFDSDYFIRLLPGNTVEIHIDGVVYAASMPSKSGTETVLSSAIKVVW